MNLKFIIVSVLLLVFAGCASDYEDTCISLKGTCDYYSCRAEQTYLVNHVTMYSTQHLACLKEKEIELLEKEIHPKSKENEIIIITQGDIK